MASLSLTATGAIVRIRSTGTEYGMHDACADDLLDRITTATGMSVLDADFPAVIIGPLFADASEWQCSHSECERADTPDEPHTGHRSHFTGAWYCDTCDSPYCELA